MRDLTASEKMSAHLATEISTQMTTETLDESTHRLKVKMDQMTEHLDKIQREILIGVNNKIKSSFLQFETNELRV